MLTIIVTILPVFLIIAAGFGAGRKELLGEGASRIINRYVIFLALPCLMFDIVATTDWKALWEPGFAIASVGGSLALFAAGLAVSRLRGLPVADMAVDGLNASYSNAAYIGLPLLTLVMGDAVRPFVTVAATLTLMTLFVLGSIMIELGHNHGHGVGRALAHAGIGAIRNPIIAGTVAGFLWWLSGLQLPAPAARFVAMLGNTASPCALVGIGLFLAMRPIGHAFTNPFALALSGLKLAVHPLITWGIVSMMPGISPLAATSAILVAALPTGTGPFMVSEYYARDGSVTSATILVSTVLSILSVAAILSVTPH